MNATTHTPTSPRAGLRLGRYELLAKLAQGGMASVYVGRAVGVAGFSRLVAIKVLHPHLANETEFVEMFLDEARIAAAIRHPNVVATHDIAEADDLGFYLVMDYIEGGHAGMLQRAVRRHGAERMPTSVVLRIVLDVLDGLEHAHQLSDAEGAELSVVHRDVSPQNILVGVDGISRLTDFGIARAESRLTNTRDGRLKGKLSYVSPEQALGKGVDARSDLFSLGVVFYELLAGERLIERTDSDLEMLKAIVELEAPLISERDPSLAGLDAFLARALARHREERFTSAAAMAGALEDAAARAGLTIADKREVAAFVREHLGNRLDRLDTCVRTAMVDAEPFEVTPSGSHRVKAREREAIASDHSVIAAESEPAPGRAPLALALAVISFACLVGLIVAVTFESRAGEPGAEAIVAPATTPPIAAAPAAAPAPAPVDVAEPTVVEAPTPLDEPEAAPRATPIPAPAARERRRRRAPRAARPAPPSAPVADPSPPAPAPISDPLADNPYRQAMP